MSNGTSFTSWTPIGNINSNAYTGTFDGQNHTISGLYFNDANTDCVGLFGYVKSGGQISNVGVVDSYFNGNNRVGGVCGCNDLGEITNCCFDSDKYIGNAVGYSDGTVTDVEGKTTARFKSGKVAYLLQGTQAGTVWGQTIGTEKYPVLGGAKVYTASNCTGYSNTENETEYHNYVNGICQWCGDVENDIMIYGQSVTLDGTIGMNVYVAADDNYDWTASFNNTVVEKPAKDENGLYKFTYQVAAKDMAEEIIFYINNAVNATVSVKGYLDTLDTGENTRLKNL
ncbi:MAG: hypothetical protein ACI4I9_09705 [Porcipelethomonas sp.]